MMQQDLENLQKTYENIPATIIATLKTSIQQYKLNSAPLHISTQYDQQSLNKIVKGFLQNQIDQEQISKLDFEFLIEGQILRGKIKSHIVRYGISCEKTIQIQYFLAFQQLQHTQSIKQDDWISRITPIITVDDSLPFALGTFAGSISIYTDKKLVLKNTIHDSMIKAIRTIPSEKQNQYYMISGGLDEKLKVHCFNLEKGKKNIFESLSVSDHDGAISSIDISPLFDRMFCTSGNTKLYIWQIPTDIHPQQKKLKNKKRHLNQSNHLTQIANQSFHNDTINVTHWASDQQIITASMDHTIKLINIQKLRENALILTKDSITTSIDTSLNQILSSHEDGFIRIWDRRDLGNPVQTYKGHSKWVSEVKYNKNSNIFASSSYDHSMKIWERRSIFPLQVLDSNFEKNFSFIWLGDDELVGGGSDSQISFFRKI